MKDNITVHSLRKAGNKVRIQHKRRYFDPSNKRWVFLTKYERSLSELPGHVQLEGKGGVTSIELTTKDGKNLASLAECSKKDGYNRKLGISIALGRILNEANQATISLP